MKTIGSLFVFAILFVAGCTQSMQRPEENKTTKLSRDSCFYNSTDKTLACGRPFTLVKAGKEYDLNDSIEISFCGLAGLVDLKANETYLIYIYEKSDQSILLDDNVSKKAFGRFTIAGKECNTTSPGQ
jgi:hypothetical protein